VGFWLAEGCKSLTRGRKYVHVDNRDLEYLKRFQKRFGGSIYKARNCYRLSIRSDELYDLLPEATASDKYIPDFVFEWDYRGFIAFLKGILKGDGRINKKGISLDSTSKKLVDDLQRLLFMHGFASNVYQVRKPGKYQTPSGLTDCKAVWRVSISKERRGTSGLGLVELLKSRIKVKNYKGKIFSVEVKNHIIAVRRNGRIMWTGNSMDALRYAVYTHGKQDKHFVFVI